MFQSGDPVADESDGARVKAMAAEKIGFEDVDATTKVALLGNDEWPFPVPLVKEGEVWRFDSVKGREEIANRRVGRNELSTIATLHEVVDAQREHFQPDIAQGVSPRTAVGLTADGEILIMTVDGRVPNVSRGLTLPGLAKYMRELGAVDAVNLDGGGSTAMAIDGKCVNHPSDGVERAVNNALLIFAR